MAKKQRVAVCEECEAYRLTTASIPHTWHYARVADCTFVVCSRRCWSRIILRHADPQPAINYVMPSGKYAGLPLGTCPDAYLEWCVSNITTPSSPLLLAASVELARRIRPNI